MRHRHRFIAQSDGTTMVDDFMFSAPYGPVGWLVSTIILKPYLTRFLRRRAAALRKMAEARGHRRPNV